MKVLVDICHPAHVHFFKNPINILKNKGHEVFVSSRSKEMTVDLLDSLGVEHVKLSSQIGKGSFSLIKELIQRDFKLINAARKINPDVMTAIGGIFIAHVGKVLSIPSVVFYDTENARLQNILTYPFASKVVVPDCYKAWTPANKTTKYKGYHELSYLHPSVFVANKDIAIRNGVVKGTRNYLLRLVSWKASHDIGVNGIDSLILHKIVSELTEHGNVIISSEADLPAEFDAYKFKGDVNQIHHVMAFCDGYIGESATMASECCVLGVPSLYIANIGRGYTDEQETCYGLVKNIRLIEWGLIKEGIAWLKSDNKVRWNQAREKLLSENINVAEYVADTLIESR